MSLYDIVYSVGNLFMTYVIYKFMEVFYTEKITDRKLEIASYAMYFVVITSLHILIKVPIVVMIANIGLFFLITCNYRSNIKKRIFTTFLIYLMIVSIEMIVIIATGHIDLGLTTRNNYESILGIIMVRLLSYVFVLIIGRYKNIRKGDVVPNTYWLCIIVLPIGTLYLLISLFMSNELANLSIFISTVIVLFINFATFYLYEDIIKILSDKTDKILLDQQKKYYDKQFELMKTSLNANKSIKHDLKNHLTSLYALAGEDKKEELLNYLSQAIDIIDQRQEFSRTGNVCIDSIINFKFQNAKKDNIDIHVDLNVPKEIKIPSFDMTVILGNLLDNALNAVKKLENHRFIKIAMKYTKGRLIIKMINSYNGTIIKKDGEIVTSKDDESNHGFGLKNIKSVLEKYNGILECEYDESTFHTTILMYVE